MASRAEGKYRATRDRIGERLRHTGAPADAEAQARSAWPPGVAAALFPRPLLPAAVLLPLIERPGGLSVLLTRRTEGLRDHPGQISFPGGRVEAGDTGPLATALREAGEELGIPPGVVEVIGYLRAHAVVTGFVVTPVVGFLPAGLVLRPDPLEVAEAFEVPLDFFLEPANRLTTTRVVHGMQLPAIEYRYGSHRIWGATASMLQTFTNLFIS